MHFQVLTLFPERYGAYLETGLPRRAFEKSLFQLHPVQLRDYADPGRKGRVDDTPYGGGPGMVVQVGPVDRALRAMPRKLPVVLFTPRGELLTQKRVRSFAQMEGVTLVCGYYEGVDQRVAEQMVDYEISLGRFILGSGDLAALCFIEAVTRLLPGYMGSDESHRDESYEEAADELLEYPQYSRPADYRGWQVPDVLLDGNHGAIDRWRQTERERITDLRRGSDV